jgi:hypothetical protein
VDLRFRVGLADITKVLLAVLPVLGVVEARAAWGVFNTAGLPANRETGSWGCAIGTMHGHSEVGTKDACGFVVRGRRLGSVECSVHPIGTDEALGRLATAVGRSSGRVQRPERATAAVEYGASVEGGSRILVASVYGEGSWSQGGQIGR